MKGELGWIYKTKGLSGKNQHKSGMPYKNPINGNNIQLTLDLEYQSIFNDNFYLEIQNHSIPEELVSHKVLNEISKKHSIPLVATNDTRYTFKEDAIDYEVMRCIGMRMHLNSPNKPKPLPKSDLYKSFVIITLLAL